MIKDATPINGTRYMIINDVGDSTATYVQVMRGGR